MASEMEMALEMEMEMASEMDLAWAHLHRKYKSYPGRPHNSQLLLAYNFVDIWW